MPHYTYQEKQLKTIKKIYITQYNKFLTANHFFVVSLCTYQKKNEGWRGGGMSIEAGRGFRGLPGSYVARPPGCRCMCVCDM